VFIDRYLSTSLRSMNLYFVPPLERAGRSTNTPLYKPDKATYSTYPSPFPVDVGTTTPTAGVSVWCASGPLFCFFEIGGLYLLEVDEGSGAAARVTGQCACRRKTTHTT
jgi:hypothetical protein